MNISQAVQGVNRLRPKKRVGRGIGSGHGKTSCRGSKGQMSRAGARLPSNLLEGGQTPLIRRIPKRGFSNETWRRNLVAITTGDLAQYFADGETVDLETLQARKLVRRSAEGFKVILNGELGKKLTVKTVFISAQAKAAIEKSGGTVVNS